MDNVSKDEREDVQKKTFAKWINAHLSKVGHPPVTDLFYDLRDGTRLLTLLEVLTEKTFKRERGRMRVHHLNNVDRALRILEENNVKLINISNEHIVDGSAKITLGLVWAVILHWQVQGVLKDVMADLQQTNMEKTLLAWCRKTTKGYEGVDIRNFTSSWRDGLAFCALLHYHMPHLFDWVPMAKKHTYARLDTAFKMAQEHFGIERLLDPEDVNTQSPDKKSVMMYVMCLFQALPQSTFSMDSLDLSVQSDSSSLGAEMRKAKKERPLSDISIGLGMYQQTLEEVLTWLLGAEDRLATMNDIGDNTKIVKEQFHDLEDLMLELTERQGSIGDVLGEGSRLLRENLMAEDESEEVRVQMKLLNTRWEELRVKAMDRQTQLHEQLMKLQHKELETLKMWLTSTEDRIANAGELGPTYADLGRQITAHQALQSDLEAEQENINSLSNMVVVVDENSSDSAYSTLEDELNALGERWAHICKWAEQRWNVLQKLRSCWSLMETESQSLGDWLRAKETQLKLMESTPTETHQEGLKQATDMQLLKAEMTIQQNQFTALQENCDEVLLHLAPNSKAHDDIPSIIENLQDRWDLLTSIIEAQAQRLSASGIDIDRVIMPVSGDVISSSTTVITDEGGTVITKTFTTKTSSTEKADFSLAKRQKLCGRSQAEFNGAVSNFVAVMDELDSKVKDYTQISVPEMEKLHDQVGKEILMQKDKYLDVLRMGQLASAETVSTGESTVENEIKMTNAKTRWSNFEKALDNIRDRITFVTVIDSITPRIEELRKECHSLEKWINEIQSTVDFTSDVVNAQLNESKERRSLITQYEIDISNLELKSEGLSNVWPEEKMELQRNIQEILMEIKNIRMRIDNWEFILNDHKSNLATLTNVTSHEEEMEVCKQDVEGKLLDTFELGEKRELSDDEMTVYDNMEMSIREDLMSLVSSLDQVDESLKDLTVLAPMKEMENSADSVKSMLERVDAEQPNLAALNQRVDESLPIFGEVEELNRRWSQVIEALNKRSTDIEKGLEKQRQFLEESSGLESWMVEVEAFLDAEEAAVGEVETLKAQLEQSNALQDDIRTLQSNVNNIIETGKLFALEGNEELKEDTNAKLKELNDKWSNAVSRANVQNLKLKDVLTKSEKAISDSGELNNWLNDVENRFSDCSVIETTSELNSACNALNDLKQELGNRSGDFVDIKDLSEEMLSSDEDGNPDVSQSFVDLIGRYEIIKSNVVNRYDSLCLSRDKYENFKKLCSDESQWLDQLEQKINKSNEKSTDAEEMSEALDELELFMQNHNMKRMDELQKLASELVAESVMTVAVQNLTHNITFGFDNLSAKAHEQRQQLEGGVHEAQQSELEYVQVLESLSQAIAILHNRTGEEQIKIIEAELKSHQIVLQKMEQRVEAYKAEGKNQAAQRLRDQVTHLLKKYDEVDDRLNLTNQSLDFELRIESISAQLNEIQTEAEKVIIQDSDPDHIDERLLMCMSVYRCLSEVKSEVESVIATGRKVVKEGLTNTPEELTLRLDRLKALYNELGGSVTTQRGRLENAVKQSRKIYKDCGQLEEWLTTTEQELDLREATIPIPNIQQETEFAQNEKEAKEIEMETFIVRLGEIQAWLEGTEKRLLSVEQLTTDEKETLLESVAKEVEKSKSEIVQIRQTAEELIAHGTLFEERLHPELTQMNERWEKISSIVKVTFPRRQSVESDNVEKSSKASSNGSQAVKHHPYLTRLNSKTSVELKDSSLHAKKRFGKVYKSDEMTLLGQPGDYRPLSDARWSSSSSSAHCSMISEGSVDFRSSKESWSGYFGEGFSQDSLYDVEKLKEKHLSPAAVPSSDAQRFSFASFSSFEETKGDNFEKSVVDDFSSSQHIGSLHEYSSSSDESYVPTEVRHKPRLSAATVYEHAVIQDLEESPMAKRRNKSSSRIKSADFDLAFKSTDSIPNQELSLPKTPITHEPDCKKPKSDQPSLALAKLKKAQLESKEPAKRSLEGALSSIPLKQKLERHKSIDSSVSTLSEAETVIHIPQNVTYDALAKKGSGMKTEQMSKKISPRVSLSEALSAERIQSNSPTDVSPDNNAKLKDKAKHINYASDVMVHTMLDSKNKSYPISGQKLKSPKGSMILNLSRESKRSARKSRSSVSSESTEEQEISLNISDSNLPDPCDDLHPRIKLRDKDSSAIPEPRVIENADAFIYMKSEKYPKDIRKSPKSELQSPKAKDACVVIGNKYAVLHDKNVPTRNKPQTPLKSPKKHGTQQQSPPIFTPLDDISRRSLTQTSFACDTRFSVGSYCTDTSEGDLNFSETEGEELPYDDTTDDDLNLEEEVLRSFAEKDNVSGVTDNGAADYFKELTQMKKNIEDLRRKKVLTNWNSCAFAASQDLEERVLRLEPDVATLISRGDTLTLTTHMTDLHQSNVIRLAVKDLRKEWTDLKVYADLFKNESEKIDEILKETPEEGKVFLSWLDVASKKLELANNDECQLKAIEKDINEKSGTFDDLNSKGKLLSKHSFEQLKPLLTLISMRWSEINVQLSHYQKGGPKHKSIGDTEKEDFSVIPDFLANVNRLREGVSVVARQLNSKTFSVKDYENLIGKEEELKSIKKDIDRLKPKIDNVESEWIGMMKRSNQTQVDHARRVMDKFREEWAQVNRGYTSKHASWLHSSDTWRSLQKTIEDFALWLNTTEDRLKNSQHETKSEGRNTQKELEKQVTLKHRSSQSLQTMGKEVSHEMCSDDGKRLQERIESLLKRWRSVLMDLAARRERLATEDVSKEIQSEFESLVTWVDQTQALMEAHVNVTDESAVSAHSQMVENQLNNLPSKRIILQEVKDSKYEGSVTIPLTTLESNFEKVSKTLPEHLSITNTKLRVIHTLVVDAEELHAWTEHMRVRIAMRNFSHEEVEDCRVELKKRCGVYESLDNTYWALKKDAEVKGLIVSDMLQSRMNSIESRLKTLESQFSTDELMSTLTACESSSSSSSDKVEMLLTGSKATPEDRNDKQKEEAIFQEHLVAPPVLAKVSDGSSPILILAALDKSILQIRDWLTLMEQMSRQQTAVVGDEEDARRLIEKQKNVLRELEGKKPQLDELVASADSLKDEGSRAQLHQQVTKLREHWDETNSVVLGRKTQLDAMVNDSHKFESKRMELEAWIHRMEARLDRMNPVGHTADMLDMQIREQKSFLSEVQQYKHHVELFTQMTSRMITIYQSDDLRRVRKVQESINQRYNHLNTSIVARGKALHTAMSSLHNFGKVLEKFFSWIIDAERLADNVQLEADKLPLPSAAHHGRHQREPPRGLVNKHKDLQSEIESRKDVLASLNATGQKLLGTLENQDEAIMLHRRLDEMNHRWNTLKHKSMAIRNRLEGTADNWNSLLLSLRELIEWVIRKDTELTSMGDSMVGDLNALSNREQDLIKFRTALDEKQPVIESNLKSGRQLIASEPSLSDTSDSEVSRGDHDGDARYRGEENARELTRSVRREVTKLSEKWSNLRDRAAAEHVHTTQVNKKLSVLLKTVEDVGSRLDEAERVVRTWGPTPQDQNIAEQLIHNIRKFRESLPNLQRGIDDVNDQASRFSAYNVPLTAQNSTALNDINNRWKQLESSVNDRWREFSGRSRDVTPLTAAQLATSVQPPWERAAAANKVPYYINHAHETTHWDHPEMMDLFDSMAEFNHIKFSAYRTASKLRSMQKKLALDRARLQLVTDVFDEHGLRGQNDRLIDINDMIVVLSTLYGRISADHPGVNSTISTDMCLNWLLNVYDSQRTGQMRVLSFRIGLISLCRGHLEEKYRYMFRLIADPNRLVDQRKLGLLLHDCVQVPRQLGEVAAFGGSNIEPSVRSCFTKAGLDRDMIEAVHFLTWVQQEPQSLVWLAVLHRVAASENVQHQVKCNICKTYPIVGLRYRCLKCLSFDMCQRCFFDGRSSKSHKITHPMHEYCTATTAGDEMKDFTKALKNKFKSKRSLQKHTKKGYLPVQTVLEGDPLESPSPSPSHNASSQDMHNRLEVYASRLAEVELRTNANSTPDSEDEHGLIAQYCQSLSSSDAPLPVPKSPLQIMATVDKEQKDELEQMIRDLEEENRCLQAEYERLKLQQPSGDELDDEDNVSQRSEAEMLAEAKLLREHKGRLEARMGILEDHNRQLEAQLNRLRQLLEERNGHVGSPNKSNTLQTKSVTASQLAMDSPAKINGHSNIGDLEKAVGSLVASMNQEKENGSLSDHSNEADYDNGGTREE